MTDLPPISVETIDHIIEHMTEEDRRHFQEIRPIRISFILQYLIDRECRISKQTFEQFVTKSLCRHLVDLHQERSKKRCAQNQKKL